MIDSLSNILGPPFEPAVPLKSMSLPSLSEETPAPSQWLDVCDSVINALSEAAQKALDERVQRVAQLEEIFRDLFFLHAELALPALSQPRPNEFPESLLPLSSREERPGLHADYERTLSLFIAANSQEDLEAAEEEDGAMHMKALEGVEPEVGLMGWATEVTDLVNSFLRR